MAQVLVFFLLLEQWLLLPKTPYDKLAVGKILFGSYMT